MVLAVCILINTHGQFQGEPHCLKPTLIETLFTEEFGVASKCLPEGQKSVNRKYTAPSA